jgi:hypothetical protein
MPSRKRLRNSSGSLDPFFKRRKQFEAALRPLNLWELFARMPREWQEKFWIQKLLDPQIEFDETVPRGRLRDVLEKSCRVAAFDVSGQSMYVRDFLTVIATCLQIAQRTPAEAAAQLPAPVAAFLNEAKPKLKKFSDTYVDTAIRALYDSVYGTILAHSRLDTRILVATPGRRVAANGKGAAVVTISTVKPEMRKVLLSGSRRQVYRAAVPSTGGIHWVSWTAEHLGQFVEPCNAQEQYPVYVQSHALRQLHERVDFAPAKPFIEAWLCQSLAAPKIVETCGGGDLLVEYRLKTFRIGYLVVTPVWNRAGKLELMAVRTFKFLTMDNTPEARLLTRNLGVARGDKSQLRLDELETFTQTDLPDNPVTHKMMEDCGCAHLFELAEDAKGEVAPPVREVAAEMLRYLRIAS